MELSEYFSRIFPSTAAQMYYPSRKNNGIFVSFCFIEAGSKSPRIAWRSLRHVSPSKKSAWRRG